MKLYRGDNQVLTDSKRPADYVKRWKKDGWIPLNATKNRYGKRWTSLWLKIEEADVREFAAAWLERQREAEELDESYRKLLDAVQERLSDAKRNKRRNDGS